MKITRLIPNLKMIKLVLAFLAIITVNNIEAQLSCGQDIDLNTWVEEGDTNQGKWEVSLNGTSVEQQINAQATFFVSPQDYFNVLIEGKIKVDTTWDNDMIGFVFGHQNPIGGGALDPSNVYINTYVFDWKQQTQTYQSLTSEEGFSLYHVNGNINFATTTGFEPEFWLRGAVGSSVSTSLGTNYANNGWNDLQEYTFQLQYTANQIIVWIDGLEVINVTGCFEPGKFGFYNNSQSKVIYSDFSYKYLYNAEVVTPTICVGDTGKFQIGGSDSCSYANYFPLGTTFSWTFGDGSTGTGLNPAHQYTNPGTYAVQLIVTDTSLCTDTTNLTMNVNALPNPDAPANVSVCQSYILPALNVGNYFTSSGGVGPIPVGTNITTTQTIFIYASSGNCNNENSFTVTIVPDITISLGNDRYICGEEVSLSPGYGFVSYLWQDGTSAPVLKTNTPSTYHVTVIDQNGCIGYTEIEVIEDCPFSLWVPNVFTPNGDQNNEQFKVIHKNLENLNVTIFNRWGQSIHTWDDLNGYWDGTMASGENVPDGVYVYLINYSYYTDSGIIFDKITGHITLLR
ncbi:MAG: hypothetical protein COB15_07865 [Flavobacteriales bacterium]|nr:MAG: hypothetical protein COB15_07865 [Flavobacteriales bacterium]